MGEETQLSMATASKEDREICDRAQAVLDLLRDAYVLGWTLTLSPEQYKVVIEILESGSLQKRKDQSNVS